MFRFLLFLQKEKYAHVFVSVYAYVHKRAGVRRGQKRALGLLGREVQLPGVDTELGSSARAVYTLNHRAVPPGPTLPEDTITHVHKSHWLGGLLSPIYVQQRSHCWWHRDVGLSYPLRPPTLSYLKNFSPSLVSSG